MRAAGPAGTADVHATGLYMDMQTACWLNGFLGCRTGAAEFLEGTA